jgi:hypothetical protein
LEKVDGDNVKFYLTKYVSKFADIDIYKLSDKKGELSTEERKAAICTLATIATNTRQFLMTRQIQKKRKKQSQCVLKKKLKVLKNSAKRK